MNDAINEENAPMDKQDGLSQDHQEAISKDQSTQMQDVQNSMNATQDQQDGLLSNNGDDSKDVTNGSLESKTDDMNDHVECDDDEDFDLMNVESSDYKESDQDENSNEGAVKVPNVSIGKTPRVVAGISKTDNESHTDQREEEVVAQSATATDTCPSLEPHTHIPEMMTEFKRMVEKGIFSHRKYKPDDAPPNWLQKLNYDTIHEYGAIGKTEHFMSALFLTITTNFQFAYDNKDEWWAKKYCKA